MIERDRIEVEAETETVKKTEKKTEKKTVKKKVINVDMKTRKVTETESRTLIVRKSDIDVASFDQEGTNCSHNVGKKFYFFEP